MLGGHLHPDLLLLAQELLQARGGEGECLPPQPHQVGVLQPGVVVAVLDGGARPKNKNKEKKMTMMIMMRTDREIDR